jgi:hypothetical protein
MYYNELLYNFVYRNPKFRDFMCDFLVGVSLEDLFVFWCLEEENSISIIENSFRDNLVL